MRHQKPFMLLLIIVPLATDFPEAGEDHSNDDCLAVFVLTHGCGNQLYAWDSLYEPKILWEQFNGEMCPDLAGKPKLFFIQACRGCKVDKPVIQYESSRRCGGQDAVDGTGFSARYFVIPTMADVLIGYSTVDGYYAWRGEDKGSVYIQTLCEELALGGNHRNLLDTLTTVNCRVAFEFMSRCPSEPWRDGVRQMPCFTSMLLWKLYFRLRSDAIEAPQ